MLTKPQIKVLISLIKGNNTLKSISQNIKISPSWASNILNQLISLNLVKVERKGNLVKYIFTDAPPIPKLLKFIINLPQFNFELFLSGLNLRILAFCIFSPKTTKLIAKALKTSHKTVQNRIAVIKKVGLLIAEKGHLIAFNKKMYPDLCEFIKELRMFSNKKVNILWKFEEKIIFETRRKEEVEGALTGFSRYTELKVPVYTNSYCCYLPEKKLKKEEIFIHSILQIEDARSLLLALTLYLKYNLILKEIEDLAREYDCHEKLLDMERILNQEKTNIFSFIKEKELKEFFQQYNVKWKH